MAVSTKELSKQDLGKIKSDTSSGTNIVPLLERAPTRSTTKELERTQFGVPKIETVGLREGIRIIRHGTDERREELAMATPSFELQSMLMQMAEKMKVSTLHARLAANPFLKEQFHPILRELVIPGIEDGTLPGEAIIILIKAPIDAVIASEAKAHMVLRPDIIPIPGFMVLIDGKTNGDRTLRRDAQRAIVDLGASFEAEKAIMAKERTAELALYAPSHTKRTDSMNWIIESGETDYQVALTNNPHITESILMKLKALNKPEVNKALFMREIRLNPAHYIRGLRGK